MIGRIAYGYHNERLQECGKCECGGVIRYDVHLARICDDCQTFFGYKIAVDAFLNDSGEEDDPADEMVHIIKKPRQKGHKTPQLEVWVDGQKEAYKYVRNQHKFGPHKNDYVKHDTRKYKSKFIEDRICLIIRSNGNGSIAQRDICGRFKQMYGEEITYSAVQSAITRMKTAGRVDTFDTSTPRGRRIIVRLIAKM